MLLIYCNDANLRWNVGFFNVMQGFSVASQKTSMLYDLFACFVCGVTAK